MQAAQKAQSLPFLGGFTRMLTPSRESTSEVFAAFTDSQTLYPRVCMCLRPRTFGSVITVASAVWKIWC